MLVKAKLIHLETLEELAVLWNPEAYQVDLLNRVAARTAPPRSPVRASAPRIERFRTRLFLDSTDRDGPQRDLELHVEPLQRWAEPGADGLPALLFVWGSFRFRGVIEELRRQWVQFDATGIPTRGWVDLSLRGDP